MAIFKYKLACLLLVIAVLTSGSVEAKKKKANKYKNILLIVADDLGMKFQPFAVYLIKGEFW